MIDLKRNWIGGFHYDRSHPLNNKVVVQTYKILMHYTEIHRNCRVGCYLIKDSFSKFYTLEQLIPEFDCFSEVVEKDKQLIPDYIKDITGPTLMEQVEEVWQLKHPIQFEYNSRSLLDDIFSYNFDKAVGIKIIPHDISELEGQSLDSFRIRIKNYVIDIAFSNQITIH